MKFIILAVVLCASCSASFAQSDTAVINKFISAQAAKESASEYEDARKVVTDDLNHDGVPDTAVLYTIEGMNGSNNYIQYLAVFLQTKKGLVYAAHEPVGGKNHRDVDLTAISNGLINLNTVNYAPKDPSCCPTIKGRTTYALAGGVLREKRRRS